MKATHPKHDCTLAVFAHELREPLSSILLAAQAMVETGSDASVLRELSGLIERQGRYLARIIDSVLETRHKEDENVRLHKEWFELTRVIEAAVETVRPILRERRHELSMVLPTSPAYLCADALRIQQVLVNLLTNAAKYTEPGGNIRVAVEGTNEHLTITVRDNGVGMSPALLPRVFHFFEQGTVQLPSARYAGLGIGLAVVKSLVESHGGHVSAHSAGPGQGSIFTVRLPVFGPEFPGKSAFAQAVSPAPFRSSLAAMTPMLDA